MDHLEWYDTLPHRSLAFLLALESLNFQRFFFSELKDKYEKTAAFRTSKIRWSFEDVLKYCKQREYIYSLKQHLTIKPLFICINPREKIVFLLPEGIQNQSEVFVCLLCEQGFMTRDGLRTHKLTHIKSVTKMCYSEELKKYICPMIGCDDPSHKDKKALQLHWKSKATSAHVRLLVCPVRQGNITECTACNTVHFSDDELKMHQSSRKHDMNVFLCSYRERRESGANVDQGVRINIQEVTFGNEQSCVDNSQDEVHFTVENNKKSEFCFSLHKNSSNSIKLTGIKHLCFNDAEIGVSDLSSVAALGTSHTLTSAEPYEVRIEITPKGSGRMRVPVLFSFEINNKKIRPVFKELVLNCINKEFWDLYQIMKPKDPFTRKMGQKQTYKRVVKSQTKLFDSRAREDVVKLDEYRVPQHLLHSFGKSYKDEQLQEQLAEENDLGASLDITNYSHIFKVLVWAEEFAQKKERERYNINNQPLAWAGKPGNYETLVSGLTERRPCVMVGDMVHVIIRGDDTKYEGTVVRVESCKIQMEFQRIFSDVYVDQKVSLSFSLKRTPFRFMHRALELAVSDKTELEQVLFPTGYAFPPLKDIKTLHLTYFSKEIERNLEQKTAIEHIVGGTSRPAPYLIYGPPGTGKTHTIVEAIKQVYTIFEKAKLLICSPQNAAVDVIAERLIQDECIMHKHIKRLHAFSRDIKDIPNKIHGISNIREADDDQEFSKESKWEVYMPDRNELKEMKIVLTTLAAAGKLVTAGLSDHFTHIFIDEAGCATEPETIIPLAGLLNIHKEFGGQVVLAGDPQQLGPVIMGGICKKYGLGQSLLERLMSHEGPYERQMSGRYDARFVTKLLESRRSHPAIIEIPNQCFYEAELRACADKRVTHLLCKWRGLPKENFPLIFHGAYGEAERESSSPSWFNRHEILLVIEYVKKLISDNVTSEKIGIISPYHQQVMKIRKALEHLDNKYEGGSKNYSKIEVASVEKFQGGERDVIIITTVLSPDPYVIDAKTLRDQFVKDKKRFNVAITRAKALLIIIGNPLMLRSDPYWQRLISYIEEHGGYVGATSPEEIDMTTISYITRSIPDLNFR